MLYKTWLQKKIKSYEKDYDDLLTEIHTTPTQELKRALRNLIDVYKKALSDFGYKSGDKVIITTDGKYLNQEGTVVNMLGEKAYSVKMPNGHIVVSETAHMRAK